MIIFIPTCEHKQYLHVIYSEISRLMLIMGKQTNTTNWKFKFYDIVVWYIFLTICTVSWPNGCKSSHCLKEAWLNVGCHWRMRNCIHPFPKCSLVYSVSMLKFSYVQCWNTLWWILYDHFSFFVRTSSEILFLNLPCFPFSKCCRYVASYKKE